MAMVLIFHLVLRKKLVSLEGASQKGPPFKERNLRALAIYQSVCFASEAVFRKRISSPTKGKRTAKK